MAKGEEYEYWDEDDSCMNCGCPEFRQSQVPGLCQDCLIDPNCNENDEEGSEKF